MKKKKRPPLLRKGISAQKRIADINRIYDMHASSGLTNRDIWKRYIWPVYGIAERTFYRMLKASADPRMELSTEDRQLLLFPDWNDGNNGERRRSVRWQQ